MGTLTSAVPELTAFESKGDESDLHPNMKPKNQENTHSEGYKNHDAEDKTGDLCSKTEAHSSSQHNKPDLFSGVRPDLQEGYNCNEDEGQVRDRCCPYDGRRKSWMVSSPQLSEPPYYGGYTVTTRKGYTIIPKMEDWIGSWSSTDDEEKTGYHYLNVYGYYNKDTKMGGYGVILRDSFGKPVTASACVQPEGVSYHYNVLDGIKAGFALALERKIYDLKLICDSLKMDHCLRMIFHRADNGLLDTGRIPYKCGVCKTCLRHIIPGTTDKEFEFMIPLLQDIIDKRDQIMCKSGYFRLEHLDFKLNKAAFLLAGLLEKQTAKSPSVEIINPAAFDNVLKTVLYKDAYEGVRFYHQQQRFLVEKKGQQLE